MHHGWLANAHGREAVKIITANAQSHNRNLGFQNVFNQ
jgi:hypothetical protein